MQADLDELPNPFPIDRRLALELPAPVIPVFDLDPTSLAGPVAPSAALRHNAFEFALADGLEQGGVVEGFRCVPVRPAPIGGC
jgi:hypothetical protein